MLPSPVLVWPLLPRSLLSVLKDRLAALPAPLVEKLGEEVLSAVEYCCERRHPLWDSPPSEARLDEHGSLVFSDCFMRPSGNTGNLASLPPALRCGGPARETLLTRLGAKSTAIAVNRHVAGHHLLCLALACTETASEPVMRLANGESNPEEPALGIR
ncbi:unnamed protein product [Effrenium voratum]|uniref:Uncharacterized protein n=1 Tax=Effrenium voratum TaxID=2562239 RepID=A0AA36J4M0_9DINO|nr:unnamed protein product [Effrenium voratum]CAJ1421369.1 unnamed protein product [Effrenium voratum]